MSISPSLQASARAAYRDLLRAAALTFRGDEIVRNAFRVKMRSEIIPNTARESDPQKFEAQITLAREVADVLRRNVVQARRVDESSNSGEDMWKLRMTQYTELGSNDTVKAPSLSISSKSSATTGLPPDDTPVSTSHTLGTNNVNASSSTNSFDDSSTNKANSVSETPTTGLDAISNEDNGGTPRPAVPRFFSQLKKAHQHRVVPELREEDIEEAFVRGSGPGGQAINKTSNNVQLLHKPTGIRVNCQETRRLQQNRKIARKMLLEKLDQLYNPGLSKQDMLRAKQNERERRRRRKAKKKAKTKAAQQTAAANENDDS